MADITLGGNAIKTNGELPSVGTIAPTFKLKSVKLEDTTLDNFKGKRLVLNIFPSIDTGV